MRILISYESGVPIYEQIKEEIRGQILRGVLKPEEALPSIRTLAKELKIGIITAKRAYDDLCAEGFLYAVHGKGVFVAKIDKSDATNYALNEVSQRIKELSAFATKNSISKNRLLLIINEILEDKDARH